MIKRRQFSKIVRPAMVNYLYSIEIGTGLRRQAADLFFITYDRDLRNSFGGADRGGLNSSDVFAFRQNNML